MRDKVEQLESLCGLLLRRWEDLHPGRPEPVADVTEIVGAAALVFSAGERPRRVVLDEVAGLVSRRATGAALRRLIAAGRLFVAVLEKSQSPNTFFQRAMAAELESATRRSAALAGDVAAVKVDVAALAGDVAAVKGDVAAVRVGVEAILAAQRGAAAGGGGGREEKSTCNLSH